MSTTSKPRLDAVQVYNINYYSKLSKWFRWRNDSKNSIWFFQVSGLYKNTQNNQMGYEVVDQTACLAKCRHGGKVKIETFRSVWFKQVAIILVLSQLCLKIHFKCDACGRGGYCCTSNPGRSHENGNCEFSMLEPLKAWYDETGHDYHMCVRPYQSMI